MVLFFLFFNEWHQVNGVVNRRKRETPVISQRVEHRRPHGGGRP